jgi:hypothetical protein
MKRRAASRRIRIAGIAFGVMTVVGTTVLGFWLGSSRGPSSEEEGPVFDPKAAALWHRPTVTEAGLVTVSGVRVTFVSLTGAGGLVDLRFQVVDPDKANALHNADTPPALIDEETGLVVSQLLMGHSHTDSYKAGTTYYLVFENPGNIVQRDGKVTVLLGPAQVEHVVVR